MTIGEVIRWPAHDGSRVVFTFCDPVARDWELEVTFLPGVDLAHVSDAYWAENGDPPEGGLESWGEVRRRLGDLQQRLGLDLVRTADEVQASIHHWQTDYVRRYNLTP